MIHHICPDHLGDWAQEGRFEEGDIIYVTGADGNCETCVGVVE